MLSMPQQYNESITNSVFELTETYHSTSKIRSKQLFTDFLKNGYELTTLTCVDTSYRFDVIMAKVQLGMLITLLDDLADNPTYYNPKLLKKLYKIDLENSNFILNDLQDEEANTFELARSLVHGLHKHIKCLPNYKKLLPILEFDLENIYMANKYSERLTSFPALGNLYESKLYGPYNMGIIAAGMIDLMGSSRFDLNAIGISREVFAKGQRLGRLANVLTTYERELKQNDVTNEIIISQSQSIGGQDYQQTLFEEFDALAKDLVTRYHVREFNISAYVDGLRKLLQLHQDLTPIL